MPYKQVSIITKRWKNQKPPIGSQIDWSHPLSRGLVGCWLMNEGGGNILYDIASKNNTIGTATSWKSTIKGPAQNFNGTTSKSENTNVSSFVNNLTKITIVVSIYPTASGEGPGFPAIVHKPVSGTDASAYWRLKYADDGSVNTTKTIAFISNWTGGVYQWSPGSNLCPFNVQKQVVFTGDNLTLSTASLYNFYVEGKKYASTIATTGSGTLPTDSIKLTIGNEPGGTRTFAGNIAYVYIYNRVLSPSEIRQLYQDPYCFIQPTRRRFYFQTGEAPAANKPTRRRVILSCN